MKKSRDMGRPREPDSDLLAKPKKCWCKSTPGTCIGSRNRNYCIVRMRKSELREVPIFRAGNRPPISSREPTRSQLGRLICSLAPHISLIKTAYRAPSNQQVSTVYPSEPMRVTSCAAVKGSVFMVRSVIRSVMSSASSSNVVGFARLLSVPCRIDR